MTTTSGVTIAFSGNAIWKNISVKFLPGNCYDLIGANGSGKWTFLKAVSGDIDITNGNISIEEVRRIAILSRDQFAFDDFSV